jgi:hypothetical protein
MSNGNIVTKRCSLGLKAEAAEGFEDWFERWVGSTGVCMYVWPGGRVNGEGVSPSGSGRMDWHSVYMFAMLRHVTDRLGGCLCPRRYDAECFGPHWQHVCYHGRRHPLLPPADTASVWAESVARVPAGSTHSSLTQLRSVEPLEPMPLANGSEHSQEVR